MPVKEVKKTKQEKETKQVKNTKQEKNWLDKMEEEWANKYESCYVCKERFCLRDLVPEPCTNVGFYYICVECFGGDSK